MATILTKRSNTASSVPVAGDLTNSTGGAELAVNTADKRLFTKDSGGTVVELGTNPSSVTLPNGTANGVPYLNGSKVLTTGSALTFDGTNFVVGASATSGSALAYLKKSSGSSDNGITGSTLFLDAGTETTTANLIRFNGAVAQALFYGRAANADAHTWGGSAGGEWMRLTSTGLGIGTSSPSYKTVVSGGSSDSVLAIHSATNTSPNAKLYLMRGTTNTFGGDGYTDWSVETSGADLTINSATSSVTSERLRIDSSGNLGLGVTPSAWSSQARAIQLGIYSCFYQNASGIASMSFNSFQNTSNIDTYRVSANPATKYEMAGGHAWYVAPSGTAGNAISFTQAMTLDASGRLNIGATSNSYGAVLELTTSNGLVSYQNSTAANGAYSSWFNNGTGNGYIGAAAQIAGGSASDFAIRAQNALVFTSGGGTERARIDSSGNLLVGTTSANARFYVVTNNTTETTCRTESQAINYTGTNNFSVLLGSGNNNTNCNHFSGYTETGTKIVIYGNGNIQNTNNSYGALSDVKLKENIVDATPKLEQLQQVRVVNYTLKSDPEQKQIGVIAQELEQIFPGMVEETPDRDEEGKDLGTKTKAVKYSVFVPMLIKAIQEQQAIINAQGTALNQLKARLDAANL